MSRANPRYRRTNPSGVPVGSTYGVVRYVVQGQFQGQMTISIFDYVGAVPGPNTTQLTTLRTNIGALIITPYRACCATDWQITAERVIPVHSNVFAGVNYFGNSGLFGTGGSASMDTEVAVIINKKTGLKGQHGRGRLSMPAVPSGAVTQSNVTLAGAITAYNNLIAAMLPGVSDGANTWNPVVSQRGLAAPRLVTNWSLLLSCTLNTLMGTIRRRRIGRGK